MFVERGELTKGPRGAMAASLRLTGRDRLAPACQTSSSLPKGFTGWRAACAGASAGCGWAGVAADQAAHEQACPIAVCQRMMAPLQARCDGLQARCDGLQAQNEKLQKRVSVLEPQNQQLQSQKVITQSQNQRLQLRVAALEGGVEGAAPHDAPPSNAAVKRMGLVEAVAALRAHVAKEVCGRVADLCTEQCNRQSAAEAGALEAVVAAMLAYPQVVSVQEQGCMALRNISVGGDAAALARKQSAAEAGALEAAAAALHAHPQAVRVQEHGCAALYYVCFGSDAAAAARRQRAVEAGGRGAATSAMQAHPGNAEVRRLGHLIIDHLLRG